MYRAVIQQHGQHKMSDFIALDGEGITRDYNGIPYTNLLTNTTELTYPHDYTLLVNSNGDYIENYNNDGLGTEECLEFLLETQEKNPGKILVGFFHNYDINMILKSLTHTALTRLQFGTYTTWRSRKTFKCYRIKYLPQRLFIVSRGYWTPEGVWKTLFTARWWDVFKFFQASFVKTLNKWSVATEDEFNEIEYMKKERENFTSEGNERIRKYSIKECELLVRLMDKMQESLNNAGLKLTSWYGAGSIASAMFKKNGVKIDGSQIPEKLPVLSAYYGGRIETFYSGIFTSPVYQYDIVSAYPHGATKLPSLSGKWTYYKKYPKRKPLTDYGIYLVQWKTNKKYTPFPFRDKQHIYWPHQGKGWYHAIEIKAAIKNFGKNHFKILRGWDYEPENELPFAWIANEFENRKRYKEENNPAEYVIKLGLNSVYGKLAQGINSFGIPKYQCYYYAGYITASCRARILDLLSQCDENDVISIATDAIFLSKSNPNLDVNSNLGGLDFKEIEKGLIIIQPGVYITPSRTVTKTRGFNSNSISYDTVKEKWEKYSILGFIEIQEQKFIGFGYALSVKWPQYWRKWMPAVKRIMFMGSPVKIPNLSDIGNNVVNLLSPTKINEKISAEYKAKTLEELEKEFRDLDNDDGPDYNDQEEWRLF